MKYRTTRLRSGAVVQAGMNAQGRNYFDRIQPRGAPYRAVVIETYVEDSPGIINQTTGVRDTRRRSKVLCDVILVRSMIPLQRVQVEQRLGVNNAQLWIPRPTTRRISTGNGIELQFRSDRGHPGGDPTPFDDMDGDIVLIDFIEGDIDFPIIRGAMEHERTLRTIVEGTGWTEGGAGAERGEAHRDESYRRFAGVEERINAAGDYLLDTVGATDDIIDETVDATGGQVRIRVKDSTEAEVRYTVEVDGTDVLEVWKDGSQVRIDLGEGATQKLVLGDLFRTFLNNFLSTEFALHQHLPGTFLAPSGGGAVTGQSGVVAALDIPPTVPPPGFTTIQMGTDVLSDLAKTKKT